MKKKQVWIILTLILALLLTACGADGAKNVERETAAADGFAEPGEGMFVTQNSLTADEAEAEAGSSVEETKMKEPEAQEDSKEASVEDFGEKIIYSGNVYIETTDFDASLAQLDRSVTQFGGFVQDSNVYGRSNGDRTAVMDRSAFYVVRIPAERFDEFMTQAGELGNVTSSGRNAVNVTSQYTDYEARLASLYTQEERLLEMLGKTADLDSLIALEARLAEVRYEIEYTERELRNLDQRIAYSTVTIELQEVEVYTETAPVKRTFGQKISDSFCDGWEDFGESVQDFVIGVVGAAPALILLIVLAVVLFVLGRRTVKKRRAGKEAPPKDPEE